MLCFVPPDLAPARNTQHTGVSNLVQKGYKKISPFFIPYAITNMGGALLAIDQVCASGEGGYGEGTGRGGEVEERWGRGMGSEGREGESGTEGEERGRSWIRFRMDPETTHNPLHPRGKAVSRTTG